MKPILPRAREIADAQVVVPTLMVASTLEQALGDPVACAELLDELFEATEGKNSYRTWVSFEAALVCLRAGEPARISRLLDRLTSTGMRRLDLLIVSARAVAAEMEGSLVDAERGYADAAVAWEELSCL